MSVISNVYIGNIPEERRVVAEGMSEQKAAVVGEVTKLTIEDSTDTEPDLSYKSLAVRTDSEDNEDNEEIEITDIMQMLKNVLQNDANFPGLGDPFLPLLHSIQEGTVPVGATTTIGEISVSFHTEPNRIKANASTKLVLRVANKDGKLTDDLDFSVHGTLNHSYIIRSDLQSEMMHIHPPFGTTGEMTQDVVFKTAGTWYMTTQLAKNGLAYTLFMTLTVHPTSTMSHTTNEEVYEPSAAYAPDFSRTRFFDEEWTVHLDTDPDRVRAGKVTLFNWTVNDENGEVPSQLAQLLDGGHNIILVHEDAPDTIWNLHGDRSIEPISKEAGISYFRHPTTENSFMYTLVLPKPGAWLFHFEISSKPLRFWINVEE